MTIEQMIEVMQAYDEGKEIQYKPVAGGSWHDEAEPSWNFSILDYRVKPDSKYRPYKDMEEMIADWKKRFNKTTATYSMPLIWVTNHKANSVITDYTKYAVMVSGTFQSLETLYEECTYLDGSPCGKKEAETDCGWSYMDKCEVYDDGTCRRDHDFDDSEAEEKEI